MVDLPKITRSGASYSPKLERSNSQDQGIETTKDPRQEAFKKRYRKHLESMIIENEAFKRAHSSEVVKDPNYKQPTFTEEEKQDYRKWKINFQRRIRGRMSK